MATRVDVSKAFETLFASGARPVTLVLQPEAFGMESVPYEIGVCLSFAKRVHEFGDERYAEPRLSFYVKDETHAVEWMPPYGPFMRYTKTDDAERGIDRGRHFGFEYVEDRGMDWTQRAVEESGVADYALMGNWPPIFRTLASWLPNTERRMLIADALEAPHVG